VKVSTAMSGSERSGRDAVSAVSCLKHVQSALSVSQRGGCEFFVDRGFRSNEYWSLSHRSWGVRQDNFEASALEHNVRSIAETYCKCLKANLPCTGACFTLESYGATFL